MEKNFIILLLVSCPRQLVSKDRVYSISQNCEVAQPMSRDRGQGGHEASVVNKFLNFLAWVRWDRNAIGQILKAFNSFNFI